MKRQKSLQQQMSVLEKPPNESEQARSDLKRQLDAVQEEVKRRAEQIVSLQSLQHQNDAIKTSQPDFCDPPLELQNTVKSFREEVRQPGELLQEEVQKLGRASKRKETCSEARIDTRGLLTRAGATLKESQGGRADEEQTVLKDRSEKEGGSRIKAQSQQEVLHPTAT